MIEVILLAIEIAVCYTIYDAIEQAKGAAKREKLKQKLRGIL